MFARQVFRVAQPLRSGIRTYATESSSSGISRTSLIAGLAASGAVGYGAYKYSQGSTTPVPETPEQAKEMVTGEASKTFTGGDQGFVSLKLDGIEEVNHNTKRFRFALPSPDEVSGLNIASALVTKFKPSEEEKPVIRPYTPISDEGARGYLDLLVKVYPNGPMSTHLHSLSPGQNLDFKGPIPKYPWSPNKHSHITLIAGGTGITPMYQLTRAIFNNPEDQTKVTLVFGNLTRDDVLLKEEFDELENTFPRRFRAFYLLDNPPEGWAHGKGHVTKELLKTVMPEPKEKDAKIFVCGPPGLYKAVSGMKKSPQDQGDLAGYLKDLGYDKDQVYKF
ncbi:MAG: hypothetical protein Q9160_005015 [Pyrenula sp. 1 TL-2023]